MPGKTPHTNIPYPLPTDRVSDYPTIAKQSADTISNALISLTPKTISCTPVTGWRVSGSLAAVTTSGHVHSLPFTICRTKGNAFTTTDGGTFSILSIPQGIAVPAIDWTNLGMVQLGSYSAPLVYRTSTRSIAVQPTSVFRFPEEKWAYGHAFWIA